jgi:hypothetical protein
MFGWRGKSFKREGDIKEIFSQKVGPANLAFARPQILEIFPNQEPVERSSMNSWEDVKFIAVDQGHRTGKAGHGGPLDRGLPSFFPKWSGNGLDSIGSLIPALFIS